MMMKKNIAWMVFVCTCIHAKTTQIHFTSSKMNLQAVSLFSTNDVIWGFDFIPGKGILFTERSGALKLYNEQNKTLMAINGAPQVYAQNQGGLLDIRLHPEYSKNGWIYLTYSVKNEKGETSTRLSRGKLTGNTLTGFEVLFTALPFVKSTLHYGSRIAFDQKSYLYLTVGERNERSLAQSLETHVGKTLRLHDDGRVPIDNPYYGKPPAKPEIWTYGHRNPQGLTVHPNTGEIWEQEHGPRGGDEINLLKKGANYGWPVISYGMEYMSNQAVGIGTEKAGMEQPKKYYKPSIAPSGLTFYTGKKLPGWTGNLFSGALALMHLNRLTLNAKNEADGEERLLNGQGFRIRNVKQGPDEWLYFSTDGGELFKISLAHSR